MSEDVLEVSRGEREPRLVNGDVITAILRENIHDPVQGPPGFSGDEEFSFLGIRECVPGDLVADLGVLRSVGGESGDDVERPRSFEVSEKILECLGPRTRTLRDDPNRTDPEADVLGGRRYRRRTGRGLRHAGLDAFTAGQTRGGRRIERDERQTEADDGQDVFVHDRDQCIVETLYATPEVGRNLSTP